MPAKGTSEIAADNQSSLVSIIITNYNYGHFLPYAVDSAFEIVQIFDIETGKPLMPFGKFGSINGGTWLPAGVHIDYDNLAYFSQYIDPRFRAKYLIYVTNQSGPFKINIYAFGEYEGNRAAAGVSTRQ